MVTVSENKIIIEIEDENPEFLLVEFKNSIIDVLQHLDFKSPHTADLASSQFFILMILRELMNESETKK